MTTTHIHDAIIVGAGYGGLGAAAQLERAGLTDFIVLEKSAHIGGVWYDNTYPGAACDTQSVIYNYTFYPHLTVSRMYAEQPELLNYLVNLAEHFGLMNRVHLGIEVTSAAWNEDEKTWQVTTTSGDIYVARAFVPAWGQLSVPFTPELPGADTFAGKTFHSARWDHSIDLTGLRVASIGAAASAVQYVPEVAKQAGTLTVFQRSANYILPRNQVIFDDAQRAEFQSTPETFEELRMSIHTQREAGFERVRHATADQATGVAEARAHLESQIVDPELREKLTPDFEFGCKRILRSDDYYPAFNRDNVELVTSGIETLTPEGIRTVDGALHEFDVIIYGTGFRSQAFQHGLEVIGRGGANLDERWGDAPEAHLGIHVDRFPNMFIVYGPNTNLNHNSIVTIMEVQHEFIVDMVRRLRDAPGTVYEVLPDVLAENSAMVQAELQKSSYSSDCSSWYKNADGRVVNNWYGTVEEYRAAVAAISPADFGLADWLEPSPGEQSPAVVEAVSA